MPIEELRRRWNLALQHRGRCVDCDSSRIWFNGVRRRTASLLEGERTVFVDDVPVRRLRCRDCRRRFSRPAERVTSRGHQQPCVVSRAVAETSLDRDATRATVACQHGCHRRTLHRWIARVAALAEPAALACTLVSESAAPTLPMVPALRPSRSSQLAALAARAMTVLALLEALVSLRGLEPPALAHAPLFVPAVASPTGTRSGAASDG